MAVMLMAATLLPRPAAAHDDAVPDAGPVRAAAPATGVRSAVSAGPATTAPSDPAIAGLIQGPVSCVPTSGGPPLCIHEDVPAPEQRRPDRSLAELRRSVGGRQAITPFRSDATGAVIDLDAPGAVIETPDGPLAVAGPTELVGPDGAPLLPAAGSRPAGLDEATPGIQCTGDGTSGPRVQAVYAWTSQDRSDEVIPLIRRWAADVAATVRVSADQSNARLNVRWVTTPGCVLSVMMVRLTGSGAGSNFITTMNVLKNKGLKRTDRRYVVWADTNVLCGIGSLYPIDRKRKNPNNVGYSGWSRIDRGCWGLLNDAGDPQSVEAHELFHNLGAVQDSAPHSSKAGHCFDEFDVMCYEDGGPRGVMQTICGGRMDNPWLDCRRDDYFNPSPPRGSYLAGHWNSAKSRYLSGEPGAPILLGIGVETPDRRPSDATFPATLHLKVVADAPLASVSVAIRTDGEGDYVPIVPTGGTPTDPVITLEDGHGYAVSAQVTDTAGRRSVVLVRDIDLPPVVGSATAVLYDMYRGNASVRVRVRYAEDRYIESLEVQHRVGDGAWTADTLTDYGDWGDEYDGYVDVARGATYRFRARVTDGGGQASDWAVTDLLEIPAARAPTVSKPSVVLTQNVWSDWCATLSYTATDDLVDQLIESVWVTVDGGTEYELGTGAHNGGDCWWVDPYGTSVFRVRVEDVDGNVVWSASSDPVTP